MIENNTIKNNDYNSTSNRKSKRNVILCAIDNNLSQSKNI
jgi:hypothetical protein